MIPLILISLYRKTINCYRNSFAKCLDKLWVSFDKWKPGSSWSVSAIWWRQIKSLAVKWRNDLKRHVNW